MLKHIIDVLLRRDVDSILGSFKKTHDQLGRVQERAEAGRRAALRREQRAIQQRARHEAIQARAYRVRAKIGEFLS